MNVAGGTPIGRPKTFDRGRVIEVAMDSYWREGVDNVSLNEVCRRAQVSKPGVYREFGGEEGLVDAALEHYASTVIPVNLAQLDLERPFGEIAGAMIEILTTKSASRPVGCLLAQMQQRSASLDPKVLERVHGLRDRACSIYAEWVDAAKSRREISCDISTEVVAAFIDIQCTTLLVQMSLGEEPELLRAQATIAFAGVNKGSILGRSKQT